MELADARSLSPETQQALRQRAVAAVVEQGLLGLGDRLRASANSMLACCPSLLTIVTYLALRVIGLTWSTPRIPFSVFSVPGAVRY